FRYQGQYEDEETGLYYNRFRYYDPDMGMYISSDPIGLAGNNPTLYGYVQDVNIFLDWLGLELIKNKADGLERERIAGDWLRKNNPDATVLSERYLRNSLGESVPDDITGSRRRVDFVVIKDGQVIGVYEVTSPTADKSEQFAKEKRIRKKGGTNVKTPGRNGKLYSIADVKTTRLDVDLHTGTITCR
ncbi:RHS repeat-associated core domain-containing protein, partial [Bacteroides fragilis]